MDRISAPSPTEIMKQFLSLLALVLALPLSAVAQEGSVLYERTVKMEFELPPEMEHMRDQIPTENTTSMILYFNELESLMKTAPKEEKEQVVVSGGEGGRIFRMGGPVEETETYQNYDDGTVSEKRDFMGRTFLIAGDQPTYAWKLTGELSEYLGYQVQKATAVQDSTLIEAWFSPEIPVSAGPELFGGLPGMILVLSVNDGQTVFSAKEISLDPVEDGLIYAPKKGKKVSRAEFDFIVEEKMKEMQTMRGGRGHNTVRIMRH
jgi:GLPGLI family protein